MMGLGKPVTGPFKNGIVYLIMLDFWGKNANPFCGKQKYPISLVPGKPSNRGSFVKKNQVSIST